MMRDQFNIYQHQEILGIPCISCSNPKHKLERCPLINYIPNRESVIKTYHKESFQNRKQFSRKSGKVPNAYAMKQKLADCSKIIILKYPDFVESLLPDEEEEEGSSLFSSMGNFKSHSVLTIENIESPNELIPKEEKTENKHSFEQIENQEFRSKKFTKKKTFIRDNIKNHTIVNEGGKDPLLNFEIGRNYKNYFPNNNLSEIIRLDCLRHQSLTSPKNKLNKAKERLRAKGGSKGAFESKSSMKLMLAIGSKGTFNNFQGKDFTLAVEKLQEKRGKD